MKTLPEINERNLRENMREGDYLAFTEMYNRYAKSLIYKLKKLVLLPEIAEEFHQDIFMSIWEEREQLPLDIPFATLLYRKARSLAYNNYRRAVLDEQYRKQLIALATEHTDILQEYLDFRDTNQVLMNSIHKLPEQRRKIFMRVKLDGKSYEEVADEFGISLSTVKDHMTRALKFIRVELAQHYPTTLWLLLAARILEC